jgi:phage terminase small subunit
LYFEYGSKRDGVVLIFISYAWNTEVFHLILYSKSGYFNERKRLTQKQECFCREYVLWLNASKAAVNAGYSKKTACVIVYENLIKPYIQNKIDYLKKNLVETAEISALRVLKEHEKIAFANAGQLRDGWITLKEFESLTEEQKACIQEISTRQAKKVIDGGEIIIEEWVKIKLYDKQKSLDSINAMLGFNAPEKQEITGSGGKDLFPEPLSIEIIDKREDVRTNDNTDNEGIQ